MSFPWAKHYEPKHPLMRWLDERLPLAAPRLRRGRRRLSGAAQPQLLLELRRPRRALPDDPDRHRHRAGDALLRANADGAFNSVEHIMRDVNAGWLLRYAHMPTARASSSSSPTSTSSAGFTTVRTRRRARWCGCSALVIFLLMMATAFMGYVLPWGQMSFWGAKVITGSFGAIPAGRRADPASGCSAAMRRTRRR